MGGITASRNKGGGYLRARVKPTNPNSVSQQEVRQAFALAIDGWNGLSSANKNAWNAYADQTPVTNSLGETIKHAGRAWYVAQAAFLLRVGESPISAAPASPGLGALGEPTGLAVSVATGITFDFASATAGPPSILIAMGPPLSAGVVDYHGPYTFAGITDAQSDATDLAIDNGRWGLPVLGERRPFRFTACDKTNGRMYNTFTTIVVVGA
jgi:hypothetical protein